MSKISKLFLQTYWDQVAKPGEFTQNQDDEHILRSLINYLKELPNIYYIQNGSQMKGKYGKYLSGNKMGLSGMLRGNKYIHKSIVKDMGGEIRGLPGYTLYDKTILPREKFVFSKGEIPGMLFLNSLVNNIGIDLKNYLPKRFCATEVDQVDGTKEEGIMTQIIPFVHLEHFGGFDKFSDGKGHGIKGKIQTDCEIIH